MSASAGIPGVGLLLGLARLWPLLLMQVAWRRAAGTAWWWLSAALALALAASSPTPPLALVFDPGVWIGELLVGLALGAVVSLPGLALLGAADTSARVLWPRGEGLELLPSTLVWGVAAVALASGLHRPVLMALTDLSRVVPVGSSPRILADGGALADALAAAAVLGLALATPALLAAAVATTAARLLQEAGGAVEASGGAAGSAASWARAGAAMVALGASLAARGPDWAAALLPGGG